MAASERWPGYIEKTLAKMVPVLIGFLASLLGLGGISGKIQKILATVQKPVMKVVDWVVGKAVAFGKKAWAGLEEARRQAQGQGQGTPRQGQEEAAASRRRRPRQIEKDEEGPPRQGRRRRASRQCEPSSPGGPWQCRLLRPTAHAPSGLRYRMTALKLVRQGETLGRDWCRQPRKEGQHAARRAQSTANTGGDSGAAKRPPIISRDGHSGIGTGRESRQAPNDRAWRRRARSGGGAHRRGPTRSRAGASAGSRRTQLARKRQGRADDTTC